MGEINIGIYKITSPSGKIYIGQSINIKERFRQYKKLGCKNQVKLYNSIKKHGWDNHIKEIIEECPVTRLDELETWYKLCCVIDLGWSKCLFHQLIDGKGGYKSDETKRKISESKKGKTIIDGIWAINISNGRKGLIQTEETKDKIRIGNLNKVFSFETRTKMRNSRLGYKRSEFSKQKQSDNIKGIKHSKDRKNRSKPIIQYDLNMNQIKEWSSIKEASETLNIDGGTLCACLKDRQKTCANYKWKYKY